MKHTLFTFTLHRRGVVLFALGAILASALLVVGGCLVGEWRAERAAGAAVEAEVGGAAPGGTTGGAAGGLAAGAVRRGASSAAARVPGGSRVAGAARVAGSARAAGAATDGSAAGAGADPGADQAAQAGGMPLGPEGVPDRYTLRLGAFPTEEEAKALADQLTARGYSATLSQARARNGATLHLVLVGSYGTLWEARGAAAELERREARERWEAVVVPAPQQ